MGTIRHIALMTVCIALLAARGLLMPKQPQAVISPSPAAVPATRPSRPNSGAVTLASDVETHPPIALDGLHFEETLPAPRFATLALERLDRRAKAMVERGDRNGLVELKLSLVQGLSKPEQVALLLADSNMCYMQFGMTKASKPEESRVWLEQCVASADAVNRVAGAHPFAYVRKAFVQWRINQDADLALATAQEGLRLRSRSAEHSQPAYDCYFWLLTQMVAIVHSARGENDSARAAVSAFSEELRRRPSDQQGLLKQAEAVDALLRRGRVFSKFVLNGRVTE